MKVAVIGGGATGLSAAWQLSRAGHEVRLFEAGARLGGSVRSDRSEGWLVESGPNSIQENSAELIAMIAELGLGAERVEASGSSKKRFIVLGGKLVALPAGPLEFFTTPVMSARTKWLIFRELTKKPRTRDRDTSVGEFVRDHFGSEIVERIVQPFISGIYAGDPERLSTRHAFPTLWEAEKSSGSLIRGLAKGAKKRREAGRPAAPKLISFRGGLQALTDAMASRLPPGAVELGAEVRRAGRGERARWRIEWVRGQECAQEEFDAVVSAVPSQSLSRLEIGGAGERPLEVLAQVEQPPVASLFLGFRREQIRHPLDGFGVLVPSVEKRSVLGILFNSTLFEGRAPDGHVALTVMCGGSLQADIARLPHDQLLATVQRDLAELIGAQGEPVFVRRSFWPRAIPQYNIGYDRYLDAISACERTWAGLFIGGNVKGGIALTDCLKSGSSLAKRVS